MNYRAFTELNEKMVHEYYRTLPSDNWMGFNLLAIDGSPLRLHDEPDIIEHFGKWNVRQGVASTNARVSQMFDVLNKITIDALITPKSEGEMELAATHFLKLMPNDLVLLDRGYPAYWLFKLILSMNSNFCARISPKRWKVIKKCDRSSDRQRIIKLEPSAASLPNCYKMGLGKDPIRLKNLTTIIANTIKDDIKKLSERRIYDYQINFAQALSKMKNTIVLLFIRSSEHMQRIVTKLQTIFIQTTERVRPGRKYIRKLKSNRKKFHLAYKPIR